MKIEKYKKLTNGMYQVFFDNYDNVILHEDVILKYELLIKKEIDEKSLENIINENNKYIGIDFAMKYLAKKMRSIKEIDDYLKKNNIDKNTREDIISILKKNNYLNDLEYSKAFINDKIILSNDGPNKIKTKLMELGVDKDIVDESILIFSDELQIEKINKISNKLINVNKTKSSNMLKNKIIDYLYRLGYSKEIINKCIDDISFKDDDNIIKKEYDKIYKKLSKKYSGNELDYKIKQKMYDLGFYNYEDMI